MITKGINHRPWAGYFVNYQILFSSGQNKTSHGCMLWDHFILYFSLFCGSFFVFIPGACTKEMACIWPWGRPRLRHAMFNDEAMISHISSIDRPPYPNTLGILLIHWEVPQERGRSIYLIRKQWGYKSLQWGCYAIALFLDFFLPRSAFCQQTLEQSSPISGSVHGSRASTESKAALIPFLHSDAWCPDMLPAAWHCDNLLGLICLTALSLISLMYQRVLRCSCRSQLVCTVVILHRMFPRGNQWPEIWTPFQCRPHNILSQCVKRYRTCFNFSNSV